MKKILFMVAAAFMFASCNKCKECVHDEYEYESWNPETGESETYGDMIQEVCSDNFETKADFNDFIDAMEDNEGWECKSDFWN